MTKAHFNRFSGFKVEIVIHENVGVGNRTPKIQFLAGLDLLSTRSYYASLKHRFKFKNNNNS